MDKNIVDLALETASYSPCAKRKVGAVIIAETGEIAGRGFNYNPGGACEDEQGNTLPNTIHAEVAAINDAWEIDLNNATIYVTHPPCKDCAADIAEVGITKTVVVGDFMKFDGDKLRYDLVPPLAVEALAEVLTYGARKYKPNNWKQCDDTSRYIAALYRHLEAWRKGEKCDPESGLHHLKHAMTNLTFLLHFEETSNG